MNVACDHTCTPPVVLVHGWGSTYERTWGGSDLERTLEQDGRRIISVDLLGHGSARAPHESGEYAHMADELAAHLPADTVVDGVGFSLGGKLLLQLAAEQPQRFRRLVIAGVGDNLLRPENGAAVAQALHAGITDDTPAALRPVLAEALASGNDPRALAAAIERPPSLLTADQLHAIGAQVLLVVGDQDVIAGAADQVSAALPHLTGLVLEGVDHVSTPHSPRLQAQAATFLHHGRAAPPELPTAVRAHPG
ncbi:MULTISPECIES: alpha/beta fold hydrolase [unclassified Rhodococcus (in: high G+C Gram-positive bacteria)]|uniref:alpha/beta fold hydrolase n=1 Tax=unclassified Rhodococcus (in: high G+C Gram-positive bacteria) TaxID=192944 RepID=UPI00163956D6|nr:MULTISPECIES: alpha/beta fold hydrolase [unclassified Rhodococcus (in: high G+C Gram-positive bacteria)]MBC2644615.1 alpha/beta fold hydrolase [Rhodococcus sp. 3A]MBC2890941.1 alpha/beta fold hydrolase [Rhodococcus sp. 4CII]MBC2897714.1 alpha/beta fold hydrolase [Rhodococcus sp. 4CII]